MNIDKRRFDELIDTILEFEGDALVDNGSSSFLSLMAYMIEGDTIEQLREGGKNVIFHAVIVGGIGRDETLRSLAAPVGQAKSPTAGRVKIPHLLTA
ncbi:hypothetical protein [Duganella qianjiadongensis]|uniref:Uncharacterized protein n=1 Tax=Duganella qianjiadongensis TaxID=2692176 RepID=A0ABW9VR05_9BURK|nr:hypothetical protein [Duganella qianjiadongensis]MYM41915.1 hypothetical protein [Duganella qianjiadongensis]